AKFRENNPTAQRSHRLAAMVEARSAAESGGGSDALADCLACPAAERPAFLVAHLRRGLAAVLRADEAALDPAAPLTAFGVDSLMAFEFKLRIDRDFKTNVPIDQLSAGTTLAELAQLLVKLLSPGAEVAEETPACPAPVPTPPITPVLHAQPMTDAGFLKVQTRTSANGTFENLTFDAAELLYLPDRVSTVGGVADDAIGAVFGADPFVSHLYEMPLGRIGVITLPIRGREMFGSQRAPGLIKKAAEMARRRGARCISLTGLIPSATDYGLAIRDWLGDGGPRITTG